MAVVSFCYSSDLYKKLILPGRYTISGLWTLSGHVTYLQNIGLFPGNLLYTQKRGKALWFIWSLLSMVCRINHNLIKYWSIIPHILPCYIFSISTLPDQLSKCRSYIDLYYHWTALYNLLLFSLSHNLYTHRLSLLDTRYVLSRSYRNRIDRKDIACILLDDWCLTARICCHLTFACIVYTGGRHCGTRTHTIPA